MRANQCFLFACILQLVLIGGALGANAKKAVETETKTVAHSKIDFDQDISLTLLEVDRYRSWATLEFELEVPRSYPLGSLDPNLVLIEGLGGRWVLRGVRRAGWKNVKFGSRTAILTLEVRGIEPTADILERVVVQLEAKKRGVRRSYQFAKFRFETIPL